MSLLSALRGSTTETRTINEAEFPWFDMTTPSSYMNEATALTLSAVWACETLIADSIAAMPVATYRKDGDTRIRTASPGWIDTPNAESTRIEFETQRMMSLLGWGNAYAVLSRRKGDGPVLERWIIEPWRVYVARPKGQGRQYFIDGKPIDPLKIQHVTGYSLPGGVTGMSVIAQASAGLGLAQAAEKFGENFFRNGANAGGVLEVPAMPAETSGSIIDRLREMFASRHAGLDNAHKPMVLTGGTTWKQLMVNPVDAQFLETRKFQVTEIGRWFRVPPHMIGDVEKSTSWGTGIEAQTSGFLTFTLLPWIQRLEQADSLLLTPPQYVKYNADGFIRADIKTRYEVSSIGIQAGFLTPNQAAAKEELPPFDGGDLHLQPLNFGVLGAEDTGDTP